MRKTMFAITVLTGLAASTTMGTAQSPKESSAAVCVKGYETVATLLRSMKSYQQIIDTDLVFIVRDLGGEEREAFWAFNEAKKNASDALKGFTEKAEDLEYVLRTCERNR